MGANPQLFGLFSPDPGQAFVDDQGGAAAVFGKRPKVAPFVGTNLSDEQLKAVSANTANAGSINEMLNRMIPGFSDLVRQGLDTSGSLMRGDLPPEVMDSLMRHSAEMGIARGDAGTQTGDFRSLRNLGIGTLEGMQQGANSMQMWTKLAETSYDPFIVKTMQQAGTTAANNAGTQANQQMKFNVAAAPDPGAAGIFNVDAALGSQMLSLGMAAAGGAIGGSGSQAPQAPTTNWQLIGGGGNSTAYQYDPRSGQYMQVPVAQPVWGGGG